MRKNQSEGFVMAEVLVTVLFVTVFTSLLFSSGARRYRSALNFAAGTEARLAAEAVVQILVENMCQEEPTGILEKLQGPEGLPETEAAVWAETGNGEKKRIETVISSYWKEHDKRMNDCLPPILFSAIFKLLKVLPDTELDAC